MIYNPTKHLKNFVILLLFIAISSCKTQYNIKKIEATKTIITPKINENKAIEDYIKPYKERVDNEMNLVLSEATINYDKSGKWETLLGNLVADITFEAANKAFLKRENKNVDICILNNGGLRANINKGDITTRTAFEVMPFENSLYIMALKGEYVIEFANYFINEKKPHPLKGLTFEIDANNKPVNLLIDNKPLDSSRIYYIATSDYLAFGGDRMDFFKKSEKSFDMDYKLRNVLIDYFKATKTLPIDREVRVKNL